VAPLPSEIPRGGLVGPFLTTLIAYGNDRVRGVLPHFW
jgi:hypothetical protein